jgi:type IV pilus assembly protein PilM
MFAKKSYVGIDLGHHTMKVAQVERTALGWRVSKYATAPTPVDTIRDGIVIDPPVLGIAPKNLLKEAHIGATNASIAVSGGTVVVRPVRIPKMAESALRKSIRFEASRYVPNSVEDSYIEFEIVDDSDETNMNVLISAAPKELVDSRMKACEAAGLEIENVEIGAFAAFRALIEADPSQEWSDKTVALLDIGASTSNLSIVSHGSFSMTRAIPNGGQVLTDTLKNYFKLNAEDAERGKAQLDVAGLIADAKVVENPPLRVLHSHLDDMVREVRRSINYWQSQQTEDIGPKQIDQIVMSGGGAQMIGLSAYFEHKLGIPTRASGVFDNVRFVGSHSEADHGFQLGLASGLAMVSAAAKAVVTSKAPKAAIEKPSKAAKPPRAPKPPKGGKKMSDEETPMAHPVEAIDPPAAMPEFEAEVQVPAAFQSVAPAAALEPTFDAAPVDLPHLEVAPEFATEEDAPPAMPAELKSAIDALLDAEAAAQEAPAQEAPAVAAKAPPVPVAAKAPPAKKPMFSVFGKGTKKPKAAAKSAAKDLAAPKPAKAPRFSLKRAAKAPTPKAAPTTAPAAAKPKPGLSLFKKRKSNEAPEKEAA